MKKLFKRKKVSIASFLRRSQTPFGVKHESRAEFFLSQFKFFILLQYYHHLSLNYLIVVRLFLFDTNL
jgi:hypothetical protein